MTDRFSLLRLPQYALKSVLRSMEPLDLIKFSFFSNRAKSLVASLNMQPKVNAVLSSHFTICVKVGEQLFRWVFYHEVTHRAFPIRIGKPELVYLAHHSNDQGEGYVVLKVMDIPSWIKHIKTIFNCSSIFQLHVSPDIGNFDLESVRDNMGDFHMLKLSKWNSDVYNRKIMKMFPTVQHLSLTTETYKNGKPPGEVLIQNFSEIDIGFPNGNPTTMKLDDILMTNAKNVIIALSGLAEKDANRFLKLWMRGNSKLEYFSLSFANEMIVDRDTVLKGIKFQEVPLEAKRYFDGFQNPIEGGIDIVRRDGIMGTIAFHDGYMDFYGWHDYCKVER